MFFRMFSFNFFNLFNLYFVKLTDSFLIASSVGLFAIKLPFLFFFQTSIKLLSFYFFNKYDHGSILQKLFEIYNRMFFFFFSKLRVKGLGFRLRKFGPFLFRFYFGSTNYIYFHMPKSVLVKLKKRNILLISNNFWKLKLVVAHLLLLREQCAYFLRGVMYPRRTFTLRVGKER